MVYDRDKDDQTLLVGVTLGWLTQEEPQLLDAWRRNIMHRATNLHQSCRHSVISQGIGDVEINVKNYARPELWEDKGYAAGYSAAQIDNLVNVITQTRGELPVADFGCGGVN